MCRERRIQPRKQRLEALPAERAPTRLANAPPRRLIRRVCDREAQEVIFQHAALRRTLLDHECIWMSQNNDPLTADPAPRLVLLLHATLLRRPYERRSRGDKRIDPLRRDHAAHRDIYRAVPPHPQIEILHRLVFKRIAQRLPLDHHDPLHHRSASAWSGASPFHFISAR